MTRVFLNYGREDQERIERLYQNLLAAGFQPWMDSHDIRPGEEWLKCIERGVEVADCCLACISSRSVQKGGVLAYELVTALEQWKKKRGRYRLIPVRLDDCEIPPNLTHLQWFDLFRDDQWTRLLPAIRSKNGGRRWIIAATAAVLLFALVGWWFFANSHPRWAPGPVRVGVTMWRLHPSDESGPPGSKILVQRRPGDPVGGPRAFSPVRLELDTSFKVGDRVRASFESAQKGYLYVIDRERLSNGELGSPKLIFPTRQIRGGRNEMEPGQLAEIPGQTDALPFWEFEKQSDAYAGEFITLLLAPEPIPELNAGEDARDLDDAWLRNKLEQWRVPVSRSQTAAGGHATSAEIEAGKTGARLTSRDPLPQTIFAGEPKRGHPLVVSFAIPVTP